MRTGLHVVTCAWSFHTLQIMRCCRQYGVNVVLLFPMLACGLSLDTSDAYTASFLRSSYFFHLLFNVQTMLHDKFPRIRVRPPSALFFPSQATNGPSADPIPCQVWLHLSAEAPNGIALQRHCSPAALMAEPMAMAWSSSRYLSAHTGCIWGRAGYSRPGPSRMLYSGASSSTG